MSAPRPSTPLRPRSTRRRRRAGAAPAVLRPHPAFILYQDIASARDALEHLSRGCAAAAAQLQPMLWRLDQVASARWRDMALRDATRAQTVVLALRDFSGFDCLVEEWLSALTEFAGKHAQRITVVALLGRDDPWSIALEPPLPDRRRATATAPGNPLPEQPDRMAAA